MTFWPRPNMLRFPNRCRILKTTAAKGPSCTGEVSNKVLNGKKKLKIKSITQKNKEIKI